MKRTSFRTAQKRLTMPIYKFGTSVLGVAIMGLALSASAKDRSDGSPANSPSQADAKPGAGPKVIKPRKSIAKTKRWNQSGIASWYGLQFQGRRTAGGERFDMNEMTCAHPTLPMGTWLRVTNLKNRRTAFVRVNDRGPVFDGRIVDLSFAAARALGMPGVANVKLEKVRESDPELVQGLLAQVQMPALVGLPSR
jgi:rare lipoprotein A